MASFFIALEKEIPGFDPFVNGNSLSKALPKLTKIAKQLNVKEPMDFFSQEPDEAEGFLESHDMDPESVPIPPLRQFSADEGLATFTALLKHLQANPQDIKNSDKVIAELEEWQRILIKAKECGVHWHLEIDF